MIIVDGQLAYFHLGLGNRYMIRSYYRSVNMVRQGDDTFPANGALAWRRHAGWHSLSRS